MKRLGIVTRAALATGSIVIIGVALLLFFPVPMVHYEHHHALANAPKLTQTKHGRAGDPINIGLAGTEKEIIQAMSEAAWVPADPITLRTSLGIVASVLLSRPYPMAPVSDLYLWNRKQDLAFEQTLGMSATRRHHVRFWCANQYAVDGRPLWIGAATFDESVGISRTAGGITHRISWDVDEERDTIIRTLMNAGQLVEIYQVTGIGSGLPRRNGGGDWYCTDGELTVGVISHNNVVQMAEPTQMRNPPFVEVKMHLWTWTRHVLGPWRAHLLAR